MKVLVLMHQDLVPPAEQKAIPQSKRLATPWITEFDVVKTLKEQGHFVYPLGVLSDLRIIRETITSFCPDIVFNLLEEFDGEAVLDQNVVSYLELLKISYTGCNPRGLMLARDKALAKKILSHGQINTPKFFVVDRSNKNKRKIPAKLKFPLIVKCLNEEASMGISQSSVVFSADKLWERVNYVLEKFQTPAIIEEFIEGREYYVGIMGQRKLETLPVWQLNFSKSSNPEKELYTTKAKFNPKYRTTKGIKTSKADLSTPLENEMIRICKKAYRSLQISGYARIDLRVDDQNNIFILEINPNPDISMDDDFALSAQSVGIKYPQLLEKILKIGLRPN